MEGCPAGYKDKSDKESYDSYSKSNISNKLLPLEVKSGMTDFYDAIIAE